MPNNLRTLKNYYHGNDVINTFDNNCNCYIVDNVQSDGIVDLTKNQLFQMYGGERIPNYLNNSKSYDCVVVVFSALDFLNDNDLKIFHYASILEEFEGTAIQYNQKYDEIYTLAMWNNDPNYGKRQLNPYHATYKNMHFYTDIFNSSLSTKDPKETISFFIYPNPANDFIIISNSDKIKSKTIYDSTGQLVKKEINQNEKIDISNLQQGVYLLEIETTNNKKIIKKIIKNND